MDKDVDQVPVNNESVNNPEAVGPEWAPKQVHAPWTPAQVESLNGYQHSALMHPFTCRRKHPARALIAIGHYARPTEAILIAETHGWWCRACCAYTQTWAWEWMTDGTWREMQAVFDQLLQQRDGEV